MSKQLSTWTEINKATAEKMAVCIEQRGAINALQRVAASLDCELETAGNDYEIENINNHHIKAKHAELNTQREDGPKIATLYKKMILQLENEIKLKEQSYQASLEKHNTEMEFKNEQMVQAKETILSLHPMHFQYKAALENTKQLEASIKTSSVQYENLEIQLAKIREKHRSNRNNKIVEFASTMLKLQKYFQLEKKMKQSTKEFEEVTRQLMAFISSQKVENIEIGQEDVAIQFSPPTKELAVQQVEQIKPTQQSIVEEVPQMTETAIQYNTETEEQVFAIPQSVTKPPPSQKVRVLQDVPVCEPKRFEENKRRMDDNNPFNTTKKYKSIQFSDDFQAMPSTSMNINSLFSHKPMDTEKSFFEANQFNFGNMDIPCFESDNDDNSDYGIGSKTLGSVEDFPPF